MDHLQHFLPMLPAVVVYPPECVFEFLAPAREGRNIEEPKKLLDLGIDAHHRRFILIVVRGNVARLLRLRR